MEIKGKVHLLFEQSGTFKKEFQKLGYEAECYDIQDNFGETDHVIDLFEEIEKAYGGCVAQMWFSLGQQDYRTWDTKRIFDYMLNKNYERSRLFSLLYKFVCVCLTRKLRMVFENPWGLNTYLKQNVFLKQPTIIDEDRTRRGDFRIKPTAYWFWNCEPTHGFTHQPYKGHVYNHNELKKAPKAGLCSEERSMISPDYARNWICDFILGKEQTNIDRQMKLEL